MNYRLRSPQLRRAASALLHALLLAQQLLYRGFASASFAPDDRGALKAAVDAWTGGDRSGDPISAWDTSKVTDMSYLFSKKDTFNDDISGWDTSRVKTFKRFLKKARARRAFVCCSVGAGCMRAD